MDLFLTEFIQIINDNLIDGYKKKSIFLMFTIEETRIAMKDEIVKKNIIENIDKISGFEFEFKSIEDYEIFVFEEYYNRTNVVFKSYFHKEDILDWDIKKFDKVLVKVKKIVKDINKKAIICTKNIGIFDVSLYKIIFFTEYLYRNILYNYMFFYLTTTAVPVTVTRSILLPSLPRVSKSILTPITALAPISAARASNSFKASSLA